MQAQAAGLDLSFLSRLWETVVRFGPPAVALIKAILDYLNKGPVPVPVFGAKASDALHPADHCDHEALCRQTLEAAICSACCAAQHYSECCEHKHG